MPLISTHLHLAILILNQEVSLASYPFLLGNIAPDCQGFTDNSAFDESHYFDGHHFNHDKFIADYIPLCRSKEDRSFVQGYFCHLLFDDFDKRNNNVEFLLPGDLTAEERKISSRNVVKRLDRGIILSFDKILLKSAPFGRALSKLRISLSVDRYQSLIEQLSYFEYIINDISVESYFLYLQNAKEEYWKRAHD